ncbi:hypothetical protein GJ496_008299 [Pomphorhynchus laevis]|nr:hypothetical protein GJ496_008299 [Pomphorhynchus laevis]
MTYHPHCCACNGQNACCKNCSCVKSGRACVDCLRNDRCANRNSLLPSTTPDYIDTSLFVTLYMKCTASKCSLRTLVKAPFSVDIEFFLKDFLCGQCSAERLHLTKQSVYEAKLAISEVKREICNIQEQLKNCLVRGSLENSKQYGNTISINDDVSNPRISSFAVVVRREVAGSIFATSHLQKELPPLKLLQQCDRESRRSQNVIISDLQNSDSDRELVDELFKELGVKVPLDLNVKLKRFISRKTDIPACVKTQITKLRWIPVILVAALIVSTYYFFTFQLCIYAIEYKAARVITLIFGQILYALLCWSFIRSILAKIPTPPSEFYISSDVTSRFMYDLDEEHSVEYLNEHAKDLPVLCRLPNGSVRFCNICMCIKPDRCHHCSVCNRCILKMDHHCPWLNRCVSFENYKYFYLTILWGFVTSLFLVGSSAKYFVQFWTVTDSDVSSILRFAVMYQFFVSLIMGISLISLLTFHTFLVSKNRTTLENYRPPAFSNGPQRKGYDLGLKRNIKECLGKLDISLLLPLKTWSGDGIHFEPKFPSIDSQL